MISVPWQWGQCRICIIMLSLGWLGGCSASYTPREHSRPTPLKHPQILNGAEDLIPFAFATGGDLRLVPPSCPGVAERAPLSKTGFIFKQDQSFHPFGCSYNRWPLVLQPSQAFSGVKMVRHKARLLKRKAQVVQQ